MRPQSPVRRLWGPTLAAAAMALAPAAQAQDWQAPSDPAVDLDWSVALRGSYEIATGGNEVKGSIAPQASLTYEGETGVSKLSTGAELEVNEDGTARLEDAHAGAAVRLRFGELTTLDASATGALAQLEADDDDLPADTLYGPYVFTGTAQASITQKIDLVEVTPRLHIERKLEGPTELIDHSLVDNTSEAYWRTGGGLRVGYALTPQLGVFVDGDISQQGYDAASPDLGVFRDNTTSTLKLGTTYGWGTIFTAEISGGAGWVDYVDAALMDGPEWLANATATVTPNDTFRLVAALDASVGPSDEVASDAEADVSATLEASQAVNSWVSLRGAASWSTSYELGSGDSDTVSSAGVGVDFTSSQHAVWSADYAYEREDAPPAASTDSHTVTVGVTIKK